MAGPGQNPGLGKIFRIMRLTVFLILIAIVQVFASKSFSQSTNLNLELKNTTVENVLLKIEEQSNFAFLYNKDLIDVQRKVDVQFKAANIEEVLRSIFSGTGVNYRIINKQIVLSPEYGQQQKNITVSGKVVDATKMALPGVAVIVKGTANGTVTDMDGQFELSNVPTDAVLVFSFVGMKLQEIAVGGKTQINITMQDETIGIEEVVAVGYGIQKKVNLTGAITSVKAEEFKDIPVANLSNAIAGRAAGVQVIGTSGLAGAASSVRIRGSFGDPLFIINGIQKGRPDFDALDPNEVESINFLKDAASASIYGSSAGNGVVLITTKNGSVQKPRFEYKSSFSTARTTKPVQDFTATEELEYNNQVAVTRDQPKPYGPEIFDYFKDKSYSINDLIWQNPSVQQHNLSVNGGTEAVSYYLGLGYHTEEGSYKNLSYDKYNFRSDVTARITKRFKVNVNLSGNQREYHRWYWPYDGAEDFNVSDFFRATFNWTRLYPFYVDEQGNPTNNLNDIPVKTSGGWHPPVLMMNSGGYRDTQYRTLDGLIRFDLDLSDFVDGLTTSFLAQMTAQDRNMKSFVPHNKFYVFQPGSTSNKFVPGPVDFTQTGSHNLSSSYENVQESVDLYSSYQYNWFINYQKQFGKHDVSAMAVYEQLGSNSKNINGRADLLLSSSIDQIFNASSDTKYRWFSGSESEYARQSWIGRFNYSYAGKYIAEFSFRYDGNYKFGTEKRWGFFPSVSAGWRISEENFMKEIDWLSNLKLRGSYGTTGLEADVFNNGIGPWLWTNKYNKTSGFVFGNNLIDGLTPGAIPNPDISWATIKLWDIGIEFGLFDNHLSGEFGIWNKKASEILGTRLGSTPTTFGGSLPAVNYAERSWKGIEFNASWKDKIGDLNYEAYGNIGWSVDQWDVYDEAAALTDGTYKDNWRSIIGKPSNRVGGYISKGIMRTQADVDALPDGFTQFGRDPKVGTILFEDIRGANYSEGPDGKIDGNDWTYLSDNGTPRINYGFGFNIDWRGISVNTHFQGVGAYDKMVSTMNSSGGGVFQVDRPYFEIWARDYWTPENPEAKYPRVGNTWMQEEYGGGPSTFWMRNGAYLRLKNLNVAYTLPVRWYNKVGVSKIQVFVNGTNLFVLSDFKEHDPEQLRLDSYPLMKTFTGGLNINF